MNKTVPFSVRRAFHWLTSIAIIAAGIGLIGGCLHLYTTQGAYSREAVAAVFSRIAVPVYTAIAFAVIGLVWEVVAPGAPLRTVAPKAYGVMIARLRTSRAIDKSAANALETEQRCRRRYAVVRLVVALIGATCFAWYAVQPSHYSADINASVIRAMWMALPCFAVPFVIAILSAWQIDKSFAREAALLKALPKIDPDKDSPATPSPKFSGVMMIVRFVLLALAIGALVYGLIAGGTVDVLTKAINICTECIGLG